MWIHPYIESLESLGASRPARIARVGGTMTLVEAGESVLLLKTSETSGVGHVATLHHLTFDQAYELADRLPVAERPVLGDQTIHE